MYVNRLSDYFADNNVTAAAPVRRTPAQRAASRRNGAHSRGPVTARGKAIARGNSLGHGLFAKIIRPADDFRGLQRDYRRTRQALIEQYRPATFTAAAEIDGLASDMLRAARARAVIEAAMKPPTTLPAEVEAAWRRVRPAERDLRVTQRALKALENRATPLLPKPQAEQLADRLAEMVAAVVSDLAEADAENDDDGDGTEPPLATVPTQIQAKRLERVEAYEAEELRELQDFIGKLGRAVNRYQDKSHLTALLSGQRKPTGADRNRLAAVLQRLITNTKCWLAGQRDVQRQVTRAGNDLLTTLAAAPEKLLLLEEYLHRIERTIQRAKDRLEGNHRAGFVFPNSRQAALPARSH